MPYLSLVYLSFFGLPKLGLPGPALAVAIRCAALYRGGNFCERRRAALHIVLRGQPLAAMSLVLSCWQVQRYIVAPQLLGLLCPPTLSLAIMMYNDSAIVIRDETAGDAGLALAALAYRLLQLRR